MSSIRDQCHEELDQNLATACCGEIVTLDRKVFSDSVTCDPRMPR